MSVTIKHGPDVFSCTREERDRWGRIELLAREMWHELDRCCAVQYPWSPQPPSYDKVMEFASRLREEGVEVSPLRVRR